MKFALKTVAIVCAFATAPLVTSGTETQAEVAYPWCAMSSISMGTQTCSFASLEQCRAYVGSTGFCQPNARAAPAEKPRRQQ
jgi:hypothetical protein